MPASFVDPAAVEAWDAWYRWRTQNELRDLTVDATWSRITQAVCSLRGSVTARDEQLIGDVISSWRLLVDERAIVAAGTPGFTWPRDHVMATINLARFVALPFTPKARFQHDKLAETVALALTVIDDICRSNTSDRHANTAPRLSIVGLADALAMLELNYADDSGRFGAIDIARGFHQACLQASVRLAHERGCADGAWRDHAVQRAEALAIAPSLRHEMRCYGLRFGPLSAIVSQPRLALLANNVADAIAPLRGEQQTYLIADNRGIRRAVASGFALTLRQQLAARSPDASVPVMTAGSISDDQRQRMREALTPWFDHAPDISYTPCDASTVLLPPAA